jgi:hypothetical protein
MGGEELRFVLQGLSYRDILINLLLRATFHTIVPEVEWVDFPLEKVQGICTLVHQINLGNYTDGTLSIWVDFPSHLQGIRVG